MIQWESLLTASIVLSCSNQQQQPMRVPTRSVTSGSGGSGKSSGVGLRHASAFFTAQAYRCEALLRLQREGL